MQCLLSLLDNVSVNLGCESFTLKHDGMFDSNMRTKEVPEIDMPTCDSLPVKMSTEYWS